ncbi:MAG: hypothetical protein KDK65_00185 [Chlamydiia bacterium]|nr:hypothetical protein [Chlamydiia bacterium]
MNRRSDSQFTEWDVTGENLAAFDSYLCWELIEELEGGGGVAAAAAAADKPEDDVMCLSSMKL